MKIDKLRDEIFFGWLYGLRENPPGQSMAEEMGIRFIDLDAYIVDREKRTIPEILPPWERPDSGNWKPGI